jgi:anti-sigma factor RsiW
MQCRELRDLADAFIGEELLVETNHEILRHLESCPECRAEIAARRELRTRLRNAFARTADLAPRGEWLSALEDRLRTEHASTGSRWHSTRTWLALAATLLVAVGIGAFALSGTRGADALMALARSAVGDHRNCAVRFNLTEKPIPLAQAAAQYDPVYRVFEGTPVAKVSARNGTIEVVERHSCVFEGRRFAHVVMKYRGELVSLLVTAEGSGPLTRLPRPGENGAMLAPGDGYHVVYQHAPGRAIFVVASGDDTVVRDVADAISADLVAHIGTV